MHEIPVKKMTRIPFAYTIMSTGPPPAGSALYIRYLTGWKIRCTASCTTVWIKWDWENAGKHCVTALACTLFLCLDFGQCLRKSYAPFHSGRSGQSVTFHMFVVLPLSHRWLWCLGLVGSAVWQHMESCTLPLGHFLALCRTTLVSCHVGVWHRSAARSGTFMRH